MVSLFLCSSGSNAWGELRPLEGLHVSSKSPSRVWDGDEGVAGRNEREKYFPDKGVNDLPSIIDLLQKGIRKKWVSGQTWTPPGWYSTTKHAQMFQAQRWKVSADLSLPKAGFVLFCLIFVLKIVYGITNRTSFLKATDFIRWTSIIVFQTWPSPAKAYRLFKFNFLNSVMVYLYLPWVILMGVTKHAQMFHAQRYKVRRFSQKFFS